MALHEVLIYVCRTHYKIMLFVYAWVLIEPHHHQAFAYLQMNLLYTYGAKNSIQYCLKLSTSSHNPAYDSVFNCKFKRSFELKPNQIPPLGTRLQPDLQAVGFKKKMSCTAQYRLNHHGFLNDLRLTSACILFAKNLLLRKYFAQNIMRYVISIKTTANSIQMDL